MMRRQRRRLKILFVARHHNFGACLNTCSGKVYVFKVHVRRSLKRLSQSCPVHKCQLKRRFQHIEQRPGINLVTAYCHIPTRCNRCWSDKTVHPSTVNMSQKLQGHVMIGAARDGGVNDDVRVEQNTHKNPKSPRKRSRDYEMYVPVAVKRPSKFRAL